jgi:hypothetical protein
MALFVVEAALDKDAGVWYVVDSNVPGLITEAASFDALCDKVLALTPELLTLNGWTDEDEGGLPAEIPIQIIAHRSSKIRLAAA